MDDDFIEWKHDTNLPGNRRNVGSSDYHKEIIAKGICPHCNHQSHFKQLGTVRESEINGHMVALYCTGCLSIFSSEVVGQMYPSPAGDSLSDLPPEIAEYYDEARRCIAANSPNGAMSVLRKLIEVVCDRYEVDIEDRTIYGMINDLADGGHITDELRESLLAVKDAGNDGAHLNENDPDVESAKLAKQVTDAVLTATVVASHRVEKVREQHPNPHSE